MGIDKKIIKETTQCNKNFECLKNNFFCMGKVENCINKKIIIIDCPESCKYKMSFGNASICNCPIRKEIFDKYKK